MRDETAALLISYDCQSGRFTCLTPRDELSNDCAVRQALSHNSPDIAPLLEQVLCVAASEIPTARSIRLPIGGKYYRAGIISTAPGVSVTITLTDLVEEALGHTAALDNLTGLMSKESFCQAVEQLLTSEKDAAARGEFALVYIDFHRFKVINELFGRNKGDLLLVFIADVLRRNVKAPGFSCRAVSDHFILFMPVGDGAVDNSLKALQTALADFDLPFEVTFHAGIYQTTATALSANTMIDRAAMALASIKGSYNTRHARYTPDMRKALLGEQEITGMMATALAEKQFIVHYQPQYNHSTGMLVGAEALVRWDHPENGLIAPGVFIPIFEKNGSITNLDLYVFRQVCAFLKKCADTGWAVVPVSVNFSRYDVFLPDFVDHLEDIRKEYDVPSKYLRVELTESVMVNGPDYINDVIRKLHDRGYVVEMDDFGSGYSSLNVLKDIDLDIIKLDMRFLSQNDHGRKGGTILSSVVRMAKWLNLPVIAEGVETVEQADFLKSIGCEYIQGYLYSRPLPEDAYVKLISASRIGATVPQMKLIDTMNACDFWDPASQETLIFSNYVGAAAIFDFHRNSLELLRVNKKFLQELGMNLSEKQLIRADPLSAMDKEDQDVYLDMLHKAIQTGEEQECDTWWNISSQCCGKERFCIRSNVRLIGISGDRYLFHSMIRNITAERLYYDAIRDNERLFKVVSEQVKVYYWEYTIATKQMRPCFRCMRDLGLPPVLTNYPESAIEANIFPPEVADMYRDFMRKIDEGAPSMEAVIPLTLDRVPFHVRYTTEFDENGHAVRAYGSATLVVD